MRPLPLCLAVTVLLFSPLLSSASPVEPSSAVKQECFGQICNADLNVSDNNGLSFTVLAEWDGESNSPYDCNPCDDCKAWFDFSCSGSNSWSISDGEGTQLGSGPTMGDYLPVTECDGVPTTYEFEETGVGISYVHLYCTCDS